MRNQLPIDAGTYPDCEIKISCIIDPEQAEEALRVVHAAFENDESVNNGQ